MKIQINFIFILLFLSTLTIGQVAPNFIITGTDGNTHNLYEDYLSQGKTVMFEIMFTSCPPCNSFASNLQPLYETWGAGAGDVQFFSFSNQGFDSNADVAAWEDMHGLTFPGAGEDGGSLQAVADYTNAGFGGFFGTPTFVVIAPDSTVTWNAGFGFSGTAKVQALHNAIAATGASLPFTTQSILGSVTTPDGDPVANVTFGIPNLSDSLGISDTTGNFGFSADLDNNTVYILNAEKDINPQNGVSTYDLVLTAKHILLVDPFTDPYQLIAADVNNSGTITTIDLVLMRKVILGIDPGFLNNRSWRFLLEDCDFTECGIDNLFSFTVNDTMENLNIIGVKVGDVNYSSNGQSLQSADDRNQQDALHFLIKNQTITTNESISIPFQSINKSIITGFQFELTFDTDFLVFSDFESNDFNIHADNFNFGKAAEGKILVSWHDAIGQSLDHAPLFHLNFHVKNPTQLKEVLQINPQEFSAEYYDNRGRISGVALVFQQPSEELQVFPNPATDMLHIHLGKSFGSTTTLRVLDVRGQVISEKYLEEGQESYFDISNLVSGVYFVELERNDTRQTRQFVKN